ncbi:MAG: NAD(P)/FAD-dependent oxidoreductase [Haloarculaceae archaeon]
MRVAVFGAGYAGLTLARRLERSLPDSADLLVVDERDTHLLQHLVHRVVRRPAVAEEITLSLLDLLDRATLVTDRVVDLDPEGGVATLADGGTLAYDVAGVCLGAATNYGGLDGVREHAIPLKRVEDARRMRERFPDGGRVVVGGAGLSGIQIAGELAALARERGVDTEVLLIEQRPSVAPGFDAAFREAVAAELAERGVSIHTSTVVETADASALHLDDGTAIEYDLLVWTGGIRGIDDVAPERPQVRSTLRHTDSTFVLGDAARVVDDSGTVVPASARTATAQARVAARNVARLVEHRLDGSFDDFEPRLDRYADDRTAWVVTVGDGAVAQVGPSVLTGSAAKALKTGVGAGYLSSVGAVERAVEYVRESVENEVS